jgi:hypothetical protein
MHGGPAQPLANTPPTPKTVNSVKRRSRSWCKILEGKKMALRYGLELNEWMLAGCRKSRRSNMQKVATLSFDLF